MSPPKLQVSIMAPLGTPEEQQRRREIKEKRRREELYGKSRLETEVKEEEGQKTVEVTHMIEE